MLQRVLSPIVSAGSLGLVKMAAAISEDRSFLLHLGFLILNNFFFFFELLVSRGLLGAVALRSSIYT